MSDSRLEKLGPLSGTVAVALLVLGAVLVGIYDFLPPAEQVAEAISSNSTGVIAGGYVGSVAAFFMIWFAGTTYASLRKRDSNGSLPMITLAGGVMVSIAMGIAFSGIYSAGLRAGADGSLNPTQAVTLYDLWGQVMSQMVGIGLAAFIAATSVISMRTDLFPGWFNWVSVIVAVGLFSPFAYLFLLPAVIWVIVVSVRLYNLGSKGESPRMAAGELGSI
jgi:hypothetical protein